MGDSKGERLWAATGKQHLLNMKRYCFWMNTFMFWMESAQERMLFSTAQRHSVIDGKMLTSLMIKYEVGIVSEDVVKLYRLDSAYFE